MILEMDILGKGWASHLHRRKTEDGLNLTELLGLIDDCTLKRGQQDS